MSTTPDLSRLRIQRDDPPPAQGGGRRTLALVLVIVGVALAVVGWFALQPRALEVQVAVANATGGGTATAGGEIVANGYVVARTRASVSAEVMGRLQSLRVEEGSYVRKGEVLARIEDSDYRAAYRAAKARTDQLVVERQQAQNDLERAKTLFERKLIPAEALERATTQLASLEAQRVSAAAQADVAAATLDKTSVRAPFQGTILRKDAEVGEIVAPSSAGGGLTRTAIVTMADLATLEVEVDVNEAYIAQVRSGQSSRITLDAYPDTSFSGQVRQVVPTADRQKATVQVKVSILDRDPRILPEMGAKVAFVRAEGEMAQAAAPRRVLVPSNAVNGSGESARVWVVEDGKVSARTVDVGPPRGEQVEIRRGLNGGESVVLSAPAGLKEGARVRIKQG